MPKKKDTEVDESQMDMDIFADMDDYEEEDFDQTFGEDAIPDLPGQYQEENFIGKAVHTAKENKLATAGIAGVIGIGLWKIFGNKNEQVQPEEQGVPQEYQDELLGLDEEDSIDDFIDQNSQRSNPLFQPLRFK